MTPRDVLEQFLDETWPHPFPVERLVEALTTAGYSIIHDSENHGPTVERAAGIAKNTFAGDTLSPTWRVASAIRAMTTGGGDAN